VPSEALKDDEMVNPNAAKNARWFMYLSVCLLLTLAVVIAARGAGRWLVREEILSSVDAIVVLSGIMPYRAAEAARLFKWGRRPKYRWADRQILPDLQRFGIRFVGEEEYSREVLIYLGVPESSVHLFPDPVVIPSKSWMKSPEKCKEWARRRSSLW
jgi:uncharacterized SAM-binding protein YcdF (DUF218 family)